MRTDPQLLCHLPVSALASEGAAGGDQLPGYCPLGAEGGHPPIHTSKGRGCVWVWGFQNNQSESLQFPCSQVLNRTGNFQSVWVQITPVLLELQLPLLETGPPDGHTLTLVKRATWQRNQTFGDKDFRITQMLPETASREQHFLTAYSPGCFIPAELGPLIDLSPKPLQSLLWASVFTNLSQK